MVTVMGQFNTYGFVGYGTKILILAPEIVGWFGSLACDSIPFFYTIQVSGWKDLFCGY